MRKFDSVGVAVPDILLPKKDFDYSKWAVVACDQFTSQPEYWEEVATIVGDAPSTLNLIYPEVYLGEDKPEDRIASIRSSMTALLDKDQLVEQKGFVYIERETADNVRKGLVLCIDLEAYDYHRGAESLIRATEGTILERIPPRVKIRKGAKLELPHIMILIDDPDNRVLGPLTASTTRMERLYDFDLMKGSGHLSGYRVNQEFLEKGVIEALMSLADREAFKKKYELDQDLPVLLFAMGDGNHSLATAKAIWEEIKDLGGDDVMSNPARHALVELVNLHDDALIFEPIHRVIFDIKDGRDLLEEMKTYYGDRYASTVVSSAGEVKEAVHAQEARSHKIGYIHAGEYGYVTISRPESNLAVGSLQLFLDKFLQDQGAREIDYVHGADPVFDLGNKKNNIGFYLPAMDKHDLFKTVILDGALPRKTFSMGEAEEKRFYMECRRIG
ncbi:DUF1015 domain-containing protein [Acidobacteriota bacterium]